MKKIVLPAYGKLNIALHVDDRDEESGLHHIDTVMQSIDWHDTVALAARRDDTCTSNLAEEGMENDNALLAAQLFVQTFGTKGADITVTKELPMGAGLGGSSADAAAVLMGMSVLYGVDMAQLTPLAMQIGSDVPFMLQKGIARVRGFGEQVEPLLPLPVMYALLVLSDQSMSSAEAYEAYDALGKKPPAVRVDDIMSLLREERNTKLLGSNSLYSVVSVRCPAVANATKALQDLRSLHIGMTGSGTCVYALYNKLEYAEAKRDALIEQGLTVHLCRLVR